MKIRSFISLDLPLSLRHELSGHAKHIAGQDKRQKIRWLPPENYHLTLVFSGDVESVKISALQLALERKLESTKAVPLTISAITPFPFSRPRIATAAKRCGKLRAQMWNNSGAPPFRSACDTWAAETACRKNSRFSSKKYFDFWNCRFRDTFS